MCQKVWAKGRAFFFLFLQDKKIKNKTTISRGRKPEILLDSEPEKLLACRQFKTSPNFPPSIYIIFF